MKSEHARRNSKKGNFLIVTSLILLAAAAFAVYYAIYLKPAETTEPVLQTARVRSGDLVVSVSGAGSLLPVTQVELGFRSAGLVTDVLVTPGQQVETGQVLAQLDDTAQQLANNMAQANLDALFTPESLALYRADVVNAQLAYDEALLKLEALETIEEGEEPPAETDLILAQARLAQAESGPG